MNTVPTNSAAELYRRIRDLLDDRSFQERRFLLAGNPISLQATTTPLLERLHEAFSHLPATSKEAALRIRIAELPCSNIVDAETFESGQTIGGHRFWTSPDRRYFCHTLLVSGSWYCINRAENEICGCVESIDRMSTFERAKPTVRPLLLWLEQRGLTPVHAGMVSWQGMGILFGGRGGSGKSTASLAALRAGLNILAEDYTLLEETGSGAFVAHSLYSSAWVEQHHLWRFPELADQAIPGDEAAQGKSILLLRETYSNRFPPSIPVRYLVLPRVRPGGRTALYTASRADGLKRFALESLVTLTRLGSNELGSLTRLVHSVDCYWLDLGADLHEVGIQLKNLVEQSG